MHVLTTHRLKIRRFHSDDWKDLYEYLSDPEVVAYEPYEVFDVVSCQEEARCRAEDPHFLAVCLGTKVIGNLYVCETNDTFNTWEMGYVFNRAYQHQGYATEAVEALMYYLFKKQGIRRLVAMCDPLNHASWHLLERVGMRREAHHLKKCYFKKDEHNAPIWKDSYEYALLKEEYKG